MIERSNEQCSKAPSRYHSLVSQVLSSDSWIPHQVGEKAFYILSRHRLVYFLKSARYASWSSPNWSRPGSIGAEQSKLIAGLPAKSVLEVLDSSAALDERDEQALEAIACGVVEADTWSGQRFRHGGEDLYGFTQELLVQLLIGCRFSEWQSDDRLLSTNW